MIAEIVAAISILINAIQGYFNYVQANRKDKVTGEDTLREDLFKLIEEQNKKIDAQTVLIDKQWQQIDTLKEQRSELKSTADKQAIQIEELQGRGDRVRAEFTEVVKKSEVQISNWRESYYMALNQVNQLKAENATIKKELEDLRVSHENLKKEHELLSANHS